MDLKANKPRAFLSHSKKDENFIRKIYDDFRRCQIDPWLDTEEIRDGKSWLNVIFEHGIPTCDVIVAYFTEHSITSTIFGKEIDAALITQLTDKGITLLPYVQDEQLRAKLRPDIRSLQCRVWNENNYQDILPSVVAEIWHCFLERIVQLATLQEKNKRLELEVELSRVKERDYGQVFSPSEDVDFDNIYRQLNKQIEISFDIWEKAQDDKGAGKKIGRDCFRFNLFEIILQCAESGFYRIDHRDVLWKAGQIVKSHGYPKVKNGMLRNYGNINMDESHLIRLKTYGLIKRAQRIDGLGKTSYEEEFTDKLYRFLYWLELKNYRPLEVSSDYLGFFE